MRGVLVSIEGIDGAGKDTQAKLVEGRLRIDGFTTFAHSYPDYASRYGKIIREYLNKEVEMESDELFFLQMLDKQKDRKIIEQELNSGGVLLMDRYLHSQIAYQSAGGFDYEKSKSIISLSGMPIPDLLVYIDIPTETARERKLVQRGGLDRYESSMDYLERVRGVYETLYRERFGASEWLKIDGLEERGKICETIYMRIKELNKLGD